MLRMRLRRTGKTKQPSYRVVIADARAKRDGAFVEVVGHYNPRQKPDVVDFKEERVRHWLERGAQPSETVHRLLFKLRNASMLPIVILADADGQFLEGLSGVADPARIRALLEKYAPGTSRT